MDRRSASGVHRVAADGFGSVAESYDRSRPSYPAEAVTWLADRLGIRPGRRVVDLAAGTGKLTRLLVPLGAQLVAVEPVAGMRAQLRRRMPAMATLAATAESLPLADASVDAITVAQAFHWFDGPRALAELARVMRPGGRLGLIWNVRDRGEDWVDRVWSVMDEVERHAPWREPGDDSRAQIAAAGGSVRGWSEADLEGVGGWTPFERATFRHVQRLSPEQVVERFRSVSHVAVLGATEQARVLARIRRILREHPDTADVALLGIPYRVDVMVTEHLR